MPCIGVQECFCPYQSAACSPCVLLVFMLVQCVQHWPAASQQLKYVALVYTFLSASHISLLSGGDSNEKLQRAGY